MPKSRVQEEYLAHNKPVFLHKVLRILNKMHNQVYSKLHQLAVDYLINLYSPKKQTNKINNYLLVVNKLFKIKICLILINFRFQVLFLKKSIGTNYLLILQISKVCQIIFGRIKKEFKPTIQRE